MSTQFTREQLLRKEKLETRRVDLGEEGHVFVRQMTGRERDRFEQSLMCSEQMPDGTTKLVQRLEDFRAKLAVNTVCDEQGNNLFEPEDYEMLSRNMSAARLELIINAAQEMNRISQKDRENLVKNSETAPNDDFISGSAEN